MKVENVLFSDTLDRFLIFGYVGSDIMLRSMEIMRGNLLPSLHGILSFTCKTQRL